MLGKREMDMTVGTKIEGPIPLKGDEEYISSL